MSEFHNGWIVTFEVGGDIHDRAFVAPEILDAHVAFMIWNKTLNNPEIKDFVVRVKWGASDRAPDTEVKG